MTAILYLIPIALGLGLAALLAFAWAVGNGQYRDLSGDGGRFLDKDEAPLSPDAARRRRALIDLGDSP